MQRFLKPFRFQRRVVGENVVGWRRRFVEKSLADGDARHDPFRLQPVRSRQHRADFFLRMPAEQFAGRGDLRNQRRDRLDGVNLFVGIAPRNLVLQDKNAKRFARSDQRHAEK